MLKPEEQRAFSQSVDKVRQVATAQLQALQARSGQTAVVHFVISLQQGVDRVVGDALAQAAHIDCQAGCSHCCSARVEAIAPEIFRIAEELRARPAAELAAILARLQARDHASHDAARDTWPEREPCVFLVDRLCSIYAVRPAACRKAHSVDVRQCEAHAAEIPQQLGIALHAEALMTGTAAAYRDRGFEAAPHELTHAVRLALLDPSAQARWLAGEAVFASV